MSQDFRSIQPVLFPQTDERPAFLVAWHPSERLALYDNGRVDMVLAAQVEHVPLETARRLMDDVRPHVNEINPFEFMRQARRCISPACELRATCATCRWLGSPLSTSSDLWFCQYPYERLPISAQAPVLVTNPDATGCPVYEVGL